MGSAVRQRGLAGQYASQGLRRYKLNASLSAGGSAAAYWVVWNPDTSAYEAQDGSGGRPTDSFTLYSESTATGNSGDQGYAAYFTDRGVWEVVGGGGGGGGTFPAVLTSPLAYATLSGASATLYVGTPGDEGPGDSITVFDWKLQPGDVIQTGYAIDVYKANGVYYLGNLACAPFYYPR